MALQHDLLHQARQLAQHEPRRPKQASLRRAVSAAYYALFHLLTAEAANRLVTGPDRDDLRAALRRAFEHKEMKEACKEMRTSNSGKLGKCLGGTTVPAQLVSVANSFINLQEARHDADYEISRTFTRSEAIDLVELAEQAFTDWQTVRRSVAADVFLTALLAKRGMCR